VFWPYLLGDVFSSALWPYHYYDPFWAYGAWPDFDYGDYGTAYAYGGGYDIYGDNGNADGRYAGRGPTTTGSARAAMPAVAPQIQAEVVQSCGGFAPGVISFPIDRIRQAVQPTSEQAAAAGCGSAIYGRLSHPPSIRCFQLASPEAESTPCRPQSP
jgi:hypothetical protein